MAYAENCLACSDVALAIRGRRAAS